MNPHSNPLLLAISNQIFAVAMCATHLIPTTKNDKKNFFERIPKLQMILQKPFLFFFSLTFREPMYFVFEW